MYQLSQTETVIGKWIDGRNIYRRYFPFGQLDETSPMRKAHDIQNLDRPVHIFGSARDTSLESRFTVALPFSSTDGNDINVSVTSSDIIIYYHGNIDKYYSCMIILDYIKQSD
jgi:hypothetical protein|nr:MAG TPA: hypothetical protein [Caudoviricetes sp.]